MPNFRRAWVPGGSFFFTVVTDRRRRLFSSERARCLLGEKLRACQAAWPFTINAIVLLPDHLHAIWSLPSGDAAYPARWAWVKKEFTKAWLAGGGSELSISSARSKEERRGVWQPRFWEHTLESDHDFDRHFDYVHYNAVKHGYVACPSAWPHSSFHRWVREGVYPADWACTDGGPLNFDDIADSVGDDR
jgi:putative transposase